MSTVLFVITGAQSWTLSDGSAHPTGYWAEEVLAPYRALTAAGHTVVVATPGAVVPVADEVSLKPENNDGADVRAELEGIDALKAPLDLHAIDGADYDAVYYPGGHGPMEDLAVDEVSGRLAAATLESGRPLAVVCHGVAALLAAGPETGTSLFAGRRVTAFSDAEEQQSGLAEKAPFLLESRLREEGLRVEVGEPWSDFTIVDGNLISGQNPQSSATVGGLLVDALS